MFLPQAPSARATPSPGRPAILHCAKDRSIPWHTIRIIGCGVVPSCMYIHIPCKVTPVCASVARLVSGVVWYSTAPKPSTRHSESACSLYRVRLRGGALRVVVSSSTYWWIAWRARDFRLIHGGLGFNRTLRSSSPLRPLQSPPDRDFRTFAFRGRPGGGAFHMLGRSGVVTLCAMVFQHVTVGQLIIILIQQRQQSSDLFLRRPH
jgi:hypothetical protein